MKINFVFFLLLLGLYPANAQTNPDYNPDFPVSKYFIRDTALSRQLQGRRHTPKLQSVKAYNWQGKPFLLLKTDTARADIIYNGTFDGKKGVWMLFYNRNITRGRSASYVLLSDVRDIEEAAQVPELAAVQKKEKQRLLNAHTFSTKVVPIFILLLATIFLFRRFYVKVGALFAAISEHPLSGCLGLFIFSPIVWIIWESENPWGKARYDNMINWIFNTMGVNLETLKTEQISDASTWHILHYESVFMLVGLAFIFLAWIGIGLMISGIISLIVMAAAGHASSATGYVNGQHVRVFNVNPTNAPDVEFGGIVTFWLIYSIVFPAMYFVADRMWHSDTNAFRPLFIATLLTVGVTALYHFTAKSKPRITDFIKMLAVSFVGFAFSIVLLFVTVLLVKTLITALAA